MSSKDELSGSACEAISAGQVPGADRDDAPKPTVFFDGSCPMCQREIGFYQRRDAGGEIEWVDVSACPAAALPEGISRSDAMARFHVRAGDGRLLSGAAGFAALWSNAPGFRWLGRIAQLPVIAPLLEGVYRAFLVVRPALQKRVQKGQRQRS